MQYFISDLHFGHTNMAIYRGFTSVEDHDNLIIENWNKLVLKKDTVWILGDVTMEKATNYSILDKLKGYKKVVLGNHDMPQHAKELLKYVNCVAGAVKLNDYFLTHVPIHPSELNRWKLNIHGHVHANTLQDKRYFNVSCEAINYTPISITDIEKTIL